MGDTNDNSDMVKITKNYFLDGLANGAQFSAINDALLIDPLLFDFCISLVLLICPINQNMFPDITKLLVGFPYPHWLVIFISVSCCYTDLHVLAMYINLQQYF